jgi:hypothetical protein
MTAYTQYWPRPPSGMNSEKVHAIIISGLLAGRSVKEIVKFHNLKRTTVWDIKRHYDTFIASRGLSEDFSAERKTHSRRSDAKDIIIVACLQELVDQDPGRSMRRLARELGISEASMGNKMAQDTRYKSYAFRQGRFMNEATKERRLAKAKLLLNRLKKQATNGQLIFFSDEKNFSQDQKINRKNN